MEEEEGDIVPPCHLAWVAGGMRMPLSLKATFSALPPTFCPRKPLPFPSPARGPLTVSPPPSAPTRGPLTFGLTSIWLTLGGAVP